MTDPYHDRDHIWWSGPHPEPDQIVVGETRGRDLDPDPVYVAQEAWADPVPNCCPEGDPPQVESLPVVEKPTRTLADYDYAELYDAEPVGTLDEFHDRYTPLRDRSPEGREPSC